MGATLQFGHGGDAVGDMAMRQVYPRGALLQFGHGGDAVGDKAGANATPASGPCFNSATAVTPWVTSVRRGGR